MWISYFALAGVGTVCAVAAGLVEHAAQPGLAQGEACCVLYLASQLRHTGLLEPPLLLLLELFSGHDPWLQGWQTVLIH
jgi:hypothetical protein